MIHNISNIIYYAHKKTKMLEEFERRFKEAEKPIQEIYSPDKIKLLHKNCITEFEKLLEEIQYIECDDNESAIILRGAITIALILPLEKEGLSTKIIEEIISE